MDVHGITLVFQSGLATDRALSLQLNHQGENDVTQLDSVTVNGVEYGLRLCGALVVILADESTVSGKEILPALEKAGIDLVQFNAWLHDVDGSTAQPEGIFVTDEPLLEWISADGEEFTLPFEEIAEDRAVRHAALQVMLAA